MQMSTPLFNKVRARLRARRHKLFPSATSGLLLSPWGRARLRSGPPGSRFLIAEKLLQGRAIQTHASDTARK